MRAALFFAGALSAAVPMLVHAQDAPAVTVRGVVVDAATEAPLRDVRVTLVEVARDVRSDAAGRFVIDGVAPGTYTLTASSIGYIFVRRAIAVAAGVPLVLTIPLAGGTGTYTETVSVTAEPLMTEGASVAIVDSAAFQALRNVTADDPMRAVQALPGVANANDFRSEFSIRGSAHRQVGIVIDGTPVPLLLHTVQAAGDTGSIAMINTDLLAGASLSTGTHPQRYGDWLGATLAFDLREGSRDRTGLRASVSGTTASVVAEGPLGRTRRGSWLASGRKSYVDWLVRQIDPEITGALGFFDVQGKVAYDLSPRQQIQFTAVAGRTGYEEPNATAPNELARASSASGFASVLWRLTGSSLIATQRVSVVANTFSNLGDEAQVQARGQTRLVSWRGDVTRALGAAWRAEAGLDATRETFDESLTDYARRRGSLVVIGRATRDLARTQAGLWAQATGLVRGRSEIAAGVRIAHDTAGGGAIASPWLLLTRPVGGLEIVAGAGRTHQAHALDLVGSLARPYEPEAAWTFDAGVRRPIGRGIDVRAAGYFRLESNVVRSLFELRAASVTRDLGDPPAFYASTLDGGSRGFDLILERRSPGGTSGWVGYSWAQTRYHDTRSGERFDGDFDQRHTLNAFAERRFSYRLRGTAKLRVGSNVPLVGYFEGEPEDLRLGTERNRVRLPTYARLDLSVSRTFTYRRSRLTVFVEVLNALGHRNLAANAGVVRSDGSSLEFVKELVPLLPSAGVLLEF